MALAGLADLIGVNKCKNGYNWKCNNSALIGYIDCEWITCIDWLLIKHGKRASTSKVILGTNLIRENLFKTTEWRDWAFSLENKKMKNTGLKDNRRWSHGRSIL